MSMAILHRRFLLSRHALFNPLWTGQRSFSSSTKSQFQFLTWYSSKLDTHPLATKMVSAGIVAFSGDVLSQYIKFKRFQSNEFKWDVVRTAKFATLGLVFIAPLTHLWYGFLLRQFPGTSVKSVVVRVGIDQFAFEPIYVPSFLTAVWLFEGESLTDISELLQGTVPKTLVANWIVWIPATALIFRYVPSKFQVLAANGVGFLWNAYVSFTAHQAEEEHDHEHHKFLVHEEEGGLVQKNSRNLL